MIRKRLLIAVFGCSALLLTTACGSGVFSPNFVSATTGGAVPVTPGPRADFVFVRCINGIETNNQTQVESVFIVTIEREVVVLDPSGNPTLDEQGNAVTRAVLEDPIRLRATSNTDLDEIGTLFPCSESAINRVGLGESLLQGDTAVIVGGQGVGGAGGTGISAASLPPLSRLTSPPNFQCGDTVVFRAITDNRVAGGVRLQSFLLPGSEQPDQFTGPNTFVNFQSFIESQQVDEDQ